MAEAVPLPVQRMGDVVPLSPMEYTTPDTERIAPRVGARCSMTPPLSLPSRQRAAALKDGDIDDGRPEQLRVNTANTMTPDDSRDMLCICTPAPKIPRPRNGE